ncbi:hypothetical protein PAPYR_3996 [Paratrimastix pyriformis]|uniref:Uncharacterized protein n=1 Tax=Paratrimastix pyriformis TaxID=342808 RepID=A0ABQ8UPF9_9EUKA|nr:hypothetical protein PAPYR_3996 [Paratrimastix pyriformis]
MLARRLYGPDWLVTVPPDEQDDLFKEKTLRLTKEDIGWIEGFEAMVDLRFLYLHQNLIEKIENLEFQPHIKFLTLNNNRIRVIEGLSHLTELVFLDLSDNLIEENAPEELPKSLRYLNIAGNPFSGRPTTRGELIGALPHLRDIDQVAVTPEERKKYRPAGTEGDDDADEEIEEEGEEGEEDEEEEGEEEEVSSSGAAAAPSAAPLPLDAPSPTVPDDTGSLAHGAQLAAEQAHDLDRIAQAAAATPSPAPATATATPLPADSALAVVVAGPTAAPAPPQRTRPSVRRLPLATGRTAASAAAAAAGPQKKKKKKKSAGAGAGPSRAAEVILTGLEHPALARIPVGEEDPAFVEMVKNVLGHAPVTARGGTAASLRQDMMQLLTKKQMAQMIQQNIDAVERIREEWKAFKTERQEERRLRREKFVAAEGQRAQELREQAEQDAQAHMRAMPHMDEALAAHKARMDALRAEALRRFEAAQSQLAAQVEREEAALKAGRPMHREMFAEDLRPDEIDRILATVDAVLRAPNLEEAAKAAAGLEEGPPPAADAAEPEEQEQQGGEGAMEEGGETAEGGGAPPPSDEVPGAEMHAAAATTTKSAAVVVPTARPEARGALHPAVPRRRSCCDDPGPRPHARHPPVACAAGERRPSCCHPQACFWSGSQARFRRGRRHTLREFHPDGDGDSAWCGGDPTHQCRPGPRGNIYYSRLSLIATQQHIPRSGAPAFWGQAISGSLAHPAIRRCCCEQTADIGRPTFLNNTHRGITGSHNAREQGSGAGPSTRGP